MTSDRFREEVQVWASAAGVKPGRCLKAKFVKDEDAGGGRMEGRVEEGWKEESKSCSCRVGWCWVEQI